MRFVLNQGGKVRNQNEQEMAMGTLLPSAYFYIDTQTENESITGYRIVGGGYGHGVGMSQNAAKAMGNAGWEYGEILAYFYHSCERSKLY